jgi:general secretion pathway protein M
VTGPSGWRGKVLALALLVAALLAGYALVVEPLYARYAEYGGEIGNARRLLASYRRLAAAKPALEAQLAEIEAREVRRNDYLEAGSDVLAAADLQSRLRGLFERFGAIQRSVQALPASDEGELLKITVRAQFSAETEALARILYELETGEPLLFVDSLDIRRKQSRRRRRNQEEAEAQAAGPLDVRLDLVGFMPKPEA